jgi:hypothetical protein
MKAIVTAQALILMPGVVVRLTAEEAVDRKHCMQSLGDGLYRATLENHFKKGQVVEFPAEIPKQYLSSCEPIADDGRVLPPASGGGVARVAHYPTPPATPVIGRSEPARPSEQRVDLDGMTKAQLIEFAEQHNVSVDAGMNKNQIMAILKKKVRAAA